MRGIATAPWLSVLIALGACDVGVYGATDGGGGGGGDSSSCAALVSPAAPMHTHAAPVVTGNPSNAGLSCLMSGCHGPTAPGTTQSAFSGTIYTDNTGATPLAGGTVTVTSGSTVLTVVSDTAGNFYYQLAPTITFPANTMSTTCPTAAAMSAQITAAMPATTGGDCNGCHNVKSPAVPTSPATFVLFQ